MFYISVLFRNRIKLLITIKIFYKPSLSVHRVPGHLQRDICFSQCRFNFLQKQVFVDVNKLYTPFEPFIPGMPCSPKKKEKVLNYCRWSTKLVRVQLSEKRQREIGRFLRSTASDHKEIVPNRPF